MAESSVLTAVLAVFMAIAQWFTDALPVITAFFYAEGALTFMGVLAVAGLAISEIAIFWELHKGKTRLQTAFSVGGFFTLLLQIPKKWQSPWYSSSLVWFRPSSTSVDNRRHPCRPRLNRWGRLSLINSEKLRLLRINRA